LDNPSPAVPLLAWYDANAADLPWRNTSDTYRIWLSEVMLQQTQIDTVISYYNRFLTEYPTIQALAQAKLDDVLKLWEGLGYYSRARNLHKAAIRISTDYKGKFPQTAQELQQLPGIGRYTAGAIASIAFDEPTPVLDGNVIRVVTRLLDIDADVTQTKTKNRLWDIVADWVPDKRPGDYNQALMELGQKICTPRKPHCKQCPVQTMCLAYKNDTQNQRPVKPKKAPTPHYDVAAGIIYNEAGDMLIAQRPNEGLLGGLWEFPGGKQEAGETLPQTLKRELYEELAIEVEVGELFVKVKHAFTHFKITLHAYKCQYIGAESPHTEPQKLGVQNWAWINLETIDNYSFGKADREIIKALRERGTMLL